MDTIIVVLRSFQQAFTDPYFCSVFLFVVVLVALQYWRLGSLRESFFHHKTGGAWLDVIKASGFGLLGGLAGSWLMLFIGLTISTADLLYLWPVAIMLMLINVRFLCFAYSGGILAVSSLLFGFPQVHVAQILALVAVLHMVESMLILFSGHLGAVPAYIKYDGDRVVGGFALQRFWPIPLVLTAMLYSGAVQLAPVVAGLGYSDVAITKNPLEKSRQSAIYLGLYSMLLLILAMLAEGHAGAALAAALFSPLGHELVIYISKRGEYYGEALYVPPDRGVKVLDVLPRLAAWQAGIRSGDIILAVNNREPTDKSSFDQIQQETFLPAVVDYFSYAAAESRRQLLTPVGRGDWGVLLVPEGNENKYVEISSSGPLGNWLKKFWGKLQS